jgi:hypothetical protein
VVGDGGAEAANKATQRFEGFTDEERGAMKARAEGAMWPVAFALQELTAAEEARIAALVKKAVH